MLRRVNELDDLKYDAQGLVTVVAQDAASGTIRMLAHATREAVEATLATRKATFFSRSRQSLWVKGESSGNTMHVREVWADCDADALVYLVDPAGPSCHTGEETCFFRRLPAGAEGRAQSALPNLEAELRARKESGGERSYTRKLLAGGAEVIGAKVREEADEFATAVDEESDERVVSEAADVMYHLMVGLLSRGVAFHQVERELLSRFGTSGIDEKESRTK